MKQMRSLFHAAITVMCLAAFTYALVLALPDWKSSPEKIQRHQGPWVYGPTDAKFTIIEYADLECPYCKEYTPWLKLWVDGQQGVNLQWHHLPLDIHGPNALYEAYLVQCAGKSGGNDAFWKAVDIVFALTAGGGQGFRDTSRLPGNEHGELDGCAQQDSQAKDAVRQDLEAAKQAGIKATPTLVITHNPSGRQLTVEGAADADMLTSALDMVAVKDPPATAN